MKFLIGAFLFLSFTAQAETPSITKVNTALQDFAQQMGRALTAEETENIGNMLLAGKSAGGLQAVAVKTETAALNMACGQMQVSSLKGRLQALYCLADNFTTYFILVVQGDAPGILLIPVGVAYARISGPILEALESNKHARTDGITLDFKGISSAVYFMGGGDMSNFEDDKGSTVSIAGLAVGIGASVGGTGFRKEEKPFINIVKSPLQFDYLEYWIKKKLL